MGLFGAGELQQGSTVCGEAVVDDVQAAANELQTVGTTVDGEDGVLGPGIDTGGGDVGRVGDDERELLVGSYGVLDGGLPHLDLDAGGGGVAAGVRAGDGGEVDEHGGSGVHAQGEEADVSGSGEEFKHWPVGEVVEEFGCPGGVRSGPGARCEDTVVVRDRERTELDGPCSVVAGTGRARRTWHHGSCRSGEPVGTHLRVLHACGIGPLNDGRACRAVGYRVGMERVVVVGASGNIGTAVVREVSAAGHQVVAVARRRPDGAPKPGGDSGGGSGGDSVASVVWQEADVSVDDLVPVFAGADAVVHLAWKFQPTHDPDETWETNAVGTRRVLEAAGAAGVQTVVCASSVAAYSPAHHDDPVDEFWPTDGASSAAYCREKAYVERLLDGFEGDHPQVRVVRLRPAFVFQPSAASEQRRIFGGVLARPTVLRRELFPVVPVPRGLRFQTVHAGDVGRAVAMVLTSSLSGPLNLAGEGVLRREDLGELLHARTVEVPPGIAEGALALAWRTRLAPVPGTLLRALMHVPVLSTAKAYDELGWRPRHTGREALGALRGLPQRAGSEMPPLHG